ncbi:hypothetical protein HK097_011528 [Rhizophlyctis rosea]|uniref:Uncharacterized protein n=1 Tax=Rhizophlyctis rosea TaxID=64517 RepID=A0AAD5SGU2_9FUNG|nr:hypothetical protein HK097_011528 [Rhizophlyctis rosea]
MLSNFAAFAVASLWAFFIRKRSVSRIDRSLAAAIVDLNVADNPNGINWSERKDMWVTTTHYTDGSKHTSKNYVWHVDMDLIGATIIQQTAKQVEQPAATHQQQQSPHYPPPTETTLSVQCEGTLSGPAKFLKRVKNSQRKNKSSTRKLSEAKRPRAAWEDTEPGLKLEALCDEYCTKAPKFVAKRFSEFYPLSTLPNDVSAAQLHQKISHVFAKMKQAGDIRRRDVKCRGVHKKLKAETHQTNTGSELSRNKAVKDQTSTEAGGESEGGPTSVGESFIQLYGSYEVGV